MLVEDRIFPNSMLEPRRKSQKAEGKKKYIYIYIYSDSKVDRTFFWRVRNLCWNSVGCWPKKKKTSSWNMALGR